MSTNLLSAHFRKKLLEWYNPTSRNLPWKKDATAYKIWLSEVILQQTRVEQGTPYYLAFVKKYPTVKTLAKAPLDEVLKLWEGLGYYSRARNLHKAAQQVTEVYNGKFPDTYEEILALKGIGSYTAAAIASFAYNLPHAVLDGNVFRVLSRVFGISTPIDTTEGKRQFEKLAASLLDKKDAATHNQAIMDLGAIICKPKNPLCEKCPFSSDCKALEHQEIQQLPVKSKKLIKSNRNLHYFVVYDDKSIYIQQRTSDDIWKGLYEFPMLETTSDQDLKKELKILFNGQPPKLPVTPFIYKQTLTHQYISGFFYEIQMQPLPNILQSLLKIRKSTINRYAYPKIVRSYLQDRLNFLS